VKDFSEKINALIPIENADRNILTSFEQLSDILETVWMNGQYLMNITISDI
jgi:hypothetical protein